MKYLYLLASIALGAGGQICLKKGAVSFSISSMKEILSPWVFAGVTVYAISVIFWVYALKYIPISRAYPSISFSYALMLLLGWLFFNEPITLVKVFSVGLITGGVILLNW
jgi:multidrug transporter EmrE-like cation transporter